MEKRRSLVYPNSHTHRKNARTRRPASADRTVRRQFQATGQPVSRTHASDAMTSRLPRYEASATQVLPMRVGPFAFQYQGNGDTASQYTVTTDRQLTALQLCRWEFLYNETFQQTFRPLLSKLSKNDKFRYFIPILRKLGAA